MNTDLTARLRESLTRRAGTTPPPSFEVDTVIGRGRRIQRVRRAGALTAATLAVVVLIGGAFFASQLLGHRTAIQPIRPAPVPTTVKLPAIGACAAGEWNFYGNVSQKDNQRLTLAAVTPNPDRSSDLPNIPSHDFNSDGKPETLRIITCRIGGSQVEAIVALTTTGPNRAVTMDNKTIVVARPAANGGQHLTAVWIETGSLGGDPFQYLAHFNGPDGGQKVYLPESKSWSHWGG